MSAGKMTDYQGFKNADLYDVLKKLRDRGGNYELKQVRDKYDDLKRSYREYNRHKGRVSGWGTDEWGVPRNTVDIENEYYAENPASKPFRYAPHKYEELMGQILGQGDVGGSAQGIADAIREFGNGGAGEEDRGEEEEECATGGSRRRSSVTATPSSFPRRGTNYSRGWACGSSNQRHTTHKVGGVVSRASRRHAPTGRTRRRRLCRVVRPPSAQRLRQELGRHDRPLPPDRIARRMPVPLALRSLSRITLMPWSRLPGLQRHDRAPSCLARSPG